MSVIGIIGSSDGPTMILVSSDNWWKLPAVIAVGVIAVITGTVIFCIKRKKKK